MSRHYSTRVVMVKRYGLWNFFVDFAMTCLTGGFWLIWVFVREIRNSR